MSSKTDLLLVAFIVTLLKKQATVQVPEFEFKGFRRPSASTSQCRPHGPPTVSPSECRPCGLPNESSTNKPCGFISIKDVALQGQKGVNSTTGMQRLPTGLMSYEEDSMIFIIDSELSRILTFEHREFVPGTGICGGDQRRRRHSVPDCHGQWKSEEDHYSNQLVPRDHSV